MSDATVLRGRVVAPDRVIEDGVLVVHDGVIEEVAPTQSWMQDHGDRELPTPCGTLLPGLVDIHTHGGGGYSLATADPAEARAAARHHHRAGTTSLAASLVTASTADLHAQVRALSPLVRAGDLALLHAEGPFLSAARCGAQAPQFLRDPDPTVVRDLLAAAEGTLKVMTLAPELPGADAVVEQLRAEGVRVALGHSDATFEVFRSRLQSLDRAGLVTHLANGMPSIHHRHPGPVTASLLEAANDAASVEVIADGVHLDAGFVELVFSTAAAGRVVLVTDAMAAAGMADGDYQLGPQQVQVRQGVARLATEDGTGGSIAGGTASLLQVVRRVVASGAATLSEAVLAASMTPARLVGIDDRVGGLTPGRLGDVVVVDDDLQLRSVIRRGQLLTDPR